MYEQEWRLYFICITKRAHFCIQIHCLPVSTVFILKAKRSERTVIGTASGDPGFKKSSMRQQVCCHECAVTMATNCHSVFVANSKFTQFINGGLSIHRELFYKIIIGFFISTGSNNWHFCCIQHSVSLGHIKNGRAAIYKCKPVFASPHLPCIGSWIIFCRISPNQYWQWFVCTRTETFWQVQVTC